MASAELFVEGARVWVTHPEKVWSVVTLSETLRPGAASVQARDEEGGELSLKTDPLPLLRNPDILLGKDDLTELTYLHQPAVLYNLRKRFLEREAIYTYCGIVLVAINPYADMSQLYMDEMIQVYLGQGKGVRRELDPHIFAVAEEAVFDLTEYHKSQAIIVSGESGAGKTVSAKLAMRYFAAVSKSREGRKGGGEGIEGRILASNPLMEAMGNAKTVRNDNSSRFGKLIQMDFTERKTIAGARMKTYLLEKSRLVSQTRSERNYHVFYQLCAARDAIPELRDLALRDPMLFHYTAMGRAPEVEGVNDLDEFRGLLDALEVLGFTKGEQSDLFRVLAGLLHLGNVQVEGGGKDSAALGTGGDETLGLLCGSLWGLAEEDLRRWLCSREIRAGGETLRTALGADEARTSRDALAKLVYEALFNWTVAKVNKALATSIASPDKKARRGKDADGRDVFIGILDIYGFETFDVNSFEQFSINYANEKLQQQFNQHVFKLEQEEYVREGLDWVEVAFEDNAPCIALIEDRPGLIELLDEQSRLGAGTDESWLAQMSSNAALKANPHFALPKIRAPAFIVRHFASDVLYSTQGFLEKNRDTVSQQLVGVLKESKFPFLDQILSAQFERAATASVRAKGPNVLNSLLAKGAPPREGGKQFRKTVGTQFRESLGDLMEILGATRPHYIRCIKPNDAKEAFQMEPRRTMEQLSACGVLETVRISAAGFPSRWPYAEFAARYRVLRCGAPRAAWRERPKAFAELVCAKHLPDAASFGLGHTKVFFRTGQVARLELARSTALDSAALVLQCAWRSFRAKRELERRRRALQTIQAAGRAYLAWHHVHFLRMHRASTAIQAAWRAAAQRRRYETLKGAVLGLQALFRGRLVRQAYLRAKLERITVAFQARARGYLARAEKRAYAAKVVLVQCCVRRWLAKREHRRLKVEARSSAGLKKLNKGLENKVISLQQRLDAQAKEDKLRLKQLEEALAKRDAELAQTSTAAADASAQRENLQAELRERESLLTEKAQTSDARLIHVQEELAELRAALDEAREEISHVGAERNSLRDQLADREMALAAAEASRLESVQRAETAEEDLALFRDMVEAEMGSTAGLGFQPRGHSSRTSFASSTQRSPSSTLRADEGIAVSNGSSPVNTLTGGVPLELVTMLKLQRRLEEVVREREELEAEAGKLRVLVEARPVAEAWASALGTFEQNMAQEAAITAAKAEKDLEAVLEERARLGPMGVDWQAMFTAAREENQRVREEAVMYRSIMQQRMERASTSGLEGQESKAEEARLEQEVHLVKQCREQKKVIAGLMGELESRDAKLKARSLELATLRSNLSPALTAQENGGGETSATDPEFQDLMHQELSRLVAENLVLQRRVEDSEASAKTKLKATANVDGAVRERSPGAASSRDVEPHSARLAVSEPTAFVRLLFYDLRPKIAALCPRPCLPAYLTLLAFRNYDSLGEGEGAVLIPTLFAPLHNAVRDMVGKSEDLDILMLWLVNAWRLLQLLRQYDPSPSDEAWHALNTPSQQSHVLSPAFDGALMREQLESRVQDAYKALLKKAIEPVLSPKIVPAILQHESTREVHSIESARVRRQDAEERASEKALSGLLEFFSLVYSKLTLFGGPECELLKRQVLGQMVEWVDGYAINHLMFNKRLCNFERAFEIKHNALEVQAWLSKMKLEGLRDRMEPVVQATHLLQSRHDVGNIDTLCGEMTARLSPKQIITLLEHYTSDAADANCRLSSDFLGAVRSRLRHLRGNNNGSDSDSAAAKDPPPKESQLMVATYLAPLDTAPFAYSDVDLARVGVPACLGLTGVASTI